MNNVENYIGHCACDIAEALDEGSLDPVEITTFLLDKIATQKSPIFIETFAERALHEAHSARKRAKSGARLSKFDGIPIAWKDLIDIKDCPTTAASKIYEEASPAKYDADVVTFATNAGLINLGKLNLSEFAYSGLGLNPHFGTPVNTEFKGSARVPGGSSSGSGVAVAMGLSPITIGTDTGGSVRIPAAFNGVVGYKSSEGRFSTNGLFSLSKTLDTIGVLALSVQDCIEIDKIFTTRNNQDFYKPSPSALTIFIPENIVFDEIETSVQTAFDDSIVKLKHAGIEIVKGELPELTEAYELSQRIGTITAAEAYFEHQEIVDGPDRSRIDHRVAQRIDLGRAMTARSYIELYRARLRAIDGISKKLGNTLVAFPTCPLTPPKIAKVEESDEIFHSVNLKVLRNTAIGNFLNMPGVALPNGENGIGLPTSFLLSAIAGNDDHLLAAASVIEPIICDKNNDKKALSSASKQPTIGE